VNAHADTSKTAARDSTVLLTVEKSLRLLNLFDVEHQQWAIRGLCQATGESKTNVLRITKTLEKYGYLERDPNTGNFRLGGGIARLSYVVLGHNELVLVASPLMRRLCDATKQTVALTVETAPGAVMLLYHVSLRFFPALRQAGGLPPQPGLATAPGKILVAFRPEGSWESVFDARIKPCTERTITDRTRLREQLLEARREAIAFDFGEWNIELGGVAAPIFGADGTACAALSVPAPIEECRPRQMGQRAKAVRKTAAEISEQLGAPLERIALLRNRSR